MKRGILFALLAALISGVSIFYNKLVVVKGIDSTVFNIIKNGGAALVVSILILSTSSRKSFSSLSKKKWLTLWWIALIGGSIPFVLFFEGLKTIPAINANLIQKSLFVWVALLAIPILKERLSLLQILGFLLVVSSNFFIGGFKGFTFTSAEGMVLIATLLWSIENVIAKVALKNTDTNIVVWGRMFLGTLLLLGYAVISGKIGLLTKVSPESILPILGSIILLSGYVLSWYKALSLAPATVMTAILVLATPITNILSAIFITHAIDMTQLVNLVLSTVGISLISYFAGKALKYGYTRTGAVQ